MLIIAAKKTRLSHQSEDFPLADSGAYIETKILENVNVDNNFKLANGEIKNQTEVLPSGFSKLILSFSYTFCSLKKNLLIYSLRITDSKGNIKPGTAVSPTTRKVVKNQLSGIAKGLYFLSIFRFIHLIHVKFCYFR